MAQSLREFTRFIWWMQKNAPSPTPLAADLWTKPAGPPDEARKGVNKHDVGICIMKLYSELTMAAFYA